MSFPSYCKKNASNKSGVLLNSDNEMRKSLTIIDKKIILT